MLLKLSEQIAECYRRAEEARRRAQETTDPSIKEDYLGLERRWIFLAHSYEFTERLQRFPKAPPRGKK